MACCCDHAISLFTSGLMAGMGAGITLTSVPALKATSDPLPAWKRLYKSGARVAITLIVTTCGTTIKCYLRTEDTRFLYVTGAFGIIVPYTLTFMRSTNQALLSTNDKEYKGNPEGENRVRELITQWSKLQYTRTALGVIGFAINVWIVCKKMKS